MGYLNESLPTENRLNQVGINKMGDVMKIIEYNGYDDIYVKFMDGNNCIVHTQYINFLNGVVKNYNKITHGFKGYLGQGEYKSEHRENGKRVHHKSYSIWSGMHDRAGNFDGRHPSYKDVYVCDEWCNYQNFAKWYEERDIVNIKNDFMCIDKDLLHPSSRVYSPDTCCLIPNRINEIFKDYDNYSKNNHGLPIGVMFRNEKDRKSVGFKVIKRELNHKGATIYTSKTFNNVPDAFKYYKMNKEKYIQDLAIYYKPILDDNVFKALMSYTETTSVNIYDPKFNNIYYFKNN